MTPSNAGRRHDGLVLALATLPVLAVWLFTGNGYGFHRDELQFLDDARHLAAGFVAYPPMTSLAGRLSIALFGISPMALRLPAAVANMLSLLLAGLIARELGGRRAAQLFTMALSLPVALAFASVLQYNTFDLLAWNGLVFCTARLLRTGEPRWWLGVGAAAGCGVLSKYSIAFPVASLVMALCLLPSQRHHLRSRWFWLGAGVLLLVASPNLLWLARHDFVTIRMEQHIHARDVRLGRANGFVTDQLKFTLLALPVVLYGLYHLLRSERYRLLSAFAVGPFVLMLLVHGRGYYFVPAYTVLMASGVVALLRRNTENAREGRFVFAGVAAYLTLAAALDVAAIAWTYLPVWPVESAAWTWQMHNNEDMANEVGWPEFAAQVAAVRNSLTPEEQSSLAVLADNYGEAGALALYGPGHGLPTPISPANSFWYRGYGVPAETVIVTGSSLEDEHSFRDCRVAARVILPHGVRDEETDDHAAILVCHHLLMPWPVAWSRNQRFG